MKKTLVLIYILFGLGVLALLVITHSTQPAIATNSTPTPVATEVISPPDQPSATLCHLEQGQNCDFLNPLDLAMLSASAPKQYPTIGARGVPTYTLVSTTFDTDMAANTINPDTFYVSQGASRISGSVRYIEASKMAVFYPETPLQPNTTYTATVTTGIQDLSDMPLTAEISWTFTTFSGRLRLDSGVMTAGASPAADGMAIYFGDLHSHTGYSDGKGTPADAFASARAKGLDFFAVTDHDIFLDEAEWQDIQAQADLATIDGQFVGLRGFEFTHLKGHINVFDTATYVRGDDPNYANLANFYIWLNDQPTAIGQFNHPTKDATLDWNFNDFAYSPVSDHKMILQELKSADQYFLSLNTGWHLGTLNNRDTHQADWGCCPLMGLVAPSLTHEAILEALRARRTFFVSPNDSKFAVVMQANGYWMGLAIPTTPMLNFTVTAYEPDPNSTPLRLFLYDNGVRVASTSLPSAELYHWTPSVPAVLGHYYYAEAYHDGWLYPAYSSPIWVERPPMVEADPPQQIVVPGAAFSLAGSNSWDPDGDALVYRWVQESGPAANPPEAQVANPTFIAPDSSGDLVFRLTVTDPGSLSASEVVAVTVTDKPVLSISKSGPATAEPGELITYTLTVTNLGITAATEVVITDAVPIGAHYVGGGDLMPGNVVSWILPDLAVNGGVAQVTFVVTASQGIVNADYRVSCAEGVSAIGSVAVVTGRVRIYLPMITKLP